MTQWESFPQYALSLRVASLPVLLVGGGAVAQRKAAALRASGAALTVVSPTLTPALQALARAQAITHVARSYEDGDVVRAGARLVFAVTSSAQVNRAVAQEAQRLNVWVNVASTEPGGGPSSGPGRGPGTFASPAVVRRGSLGIAVSTDGSSPLLARAVREWLDERLGQELAALAEWAGAVRRAGIVGSDGGGGVDDSELLAAFRSWLRGDGGPLFLVHDRLAVSGSALPGAPQPPDPGQPAG